MSKPARPKQSLPKQGVVAATDPAAFGFPAKRRCQGATRYGQPCRLWATAGGDFCYWCERAGRPRYPVARPAGEAGDTAGTAGVRKQRCRGMTVFGEPCGCFSAGDDGLCLWCQGAEKRGKPTLTG